MKKLTALFLMISMLFSLALAEPSEVDLGDMTITLDSDMDMVTSPKQDGGVIFTCTPITDDPSSLMIMWQDAQTDWNNVSEKDLEAFMEGVGQGIANIIGEDALKESSMESHEPVEIDGKPGLNLLCRLILDMSSLGGQFEGITLEMYMDGMFVSGDFGSYMFLGWSMDRQLLQEKIMPLFDTVRWK